MQADDPGLSLQQELRAMLSAGWNFAGTPPCNWTCSTATTDARSAAAPSAPCYLRSWQRPGQLAQPGNCPKHFRPPAQHIQSPPGRIYIRLKWGEYNRYGQPSARACRFDNICFNAASQHFEYYRGASNAPLFYDQKGEAHYDFPADFVNTGHADIPGQRFWAPEVLAQPFPTESAVFAGTPVAAYASLNDFLGNFGHSLYDFLFPVFNLLQILGLYTPDFQLILAEQQGQNPGAAAAFLTTNDTDRSLMRLISRHKPVTKQQIGNSRNYTGLVCFRSLAAGTGSLQLTMARTRALPFRAAAFMNAGLTDEPDLAAGRPLITVLKKKGRRMIENTDAIVKRLTARFTSAEVAVLDGDAIAVMPIPQQLEEMSKTSILITPCGGTGTVLTFLQPGATAIVMNYWHTERNMSEQMENIYYWNLEYLDLEYFPVLPEDYEGTHDRPGCEKTPDQAVYKDQGAFIHCNILIKQLERLDNTVAGALRRWAINHDRPTPQGS